jgi:hypothetical protein
MPRVLQYFDSSESVRPLLPLLALQAIQHRASAPPRGGCTLPTHTGCRRDAERRREADGQCAPFLTQVLAPNSRAASSLARRIPSSVR